MRLIASLIRAAARLALAVRFYWKLNYSWRLAWVKAQRGRP